MSDRPNFRIEFFADSRFRVDRKYVRNSVGELLLKFGFSDQPILIEITLVGNRKMRQLNLKHRDIDKPTDVLSFPLEDQRLAPDGFIHLGDVIVSYPEARQMAVKMNRLVDQVISELVLHGVRHLLGEHHE